MFDLCCKTRHIKNLYNFAAEIEQPSHMRVMLSYYECTNSQMLTGYML